MEGQKPTLPGTGNKNKNWDGLIRIVRTRPVVVKELVELNVSDPVLDYSLDYINSLQHYLLNSNVINSKVVPRCATIL